MPDGSVIQEAQQSLRHSIESVLAPHLKRLNKADRAAVLNTAAEYATYGARAKSQRDTAELRARANQALAHARDVELANADLRQAQVALRKAHQQAEERAQYWRASYTEAAKREIELEDRLVARRQPWWAWWSR